MLLHTFMLKPTVKVLIQGYAHPGDGDEYIASPTVTLIQYDDKNILVDTGCNDKKLMTALLENDLRTYNIDAIFFTHYHLDHTISIRLFPETPVYDSAMRYTQDNETPFTELLNISAIKLMPTPGHASEHTALLIDSDNLGLICIAADVFWWEDGKQSTTNIEEMINYPDPFANDFEALKLSRKKVLDSGAFWIIPGHGEIFKNPPIND